MKTLEVTKEEFKGNIALALTLLEVSIPEAVSLQIEETESAYLFHAETETVQDYGVSASFRRTTTVSNEYWSIV